MYKFIVLLALLALIVAQQGFQQALEELFNMADTDGNQHLTLAEADATLTLLDADNDGSVDRTEFTAVLAVNPVFAGFENALFDVLDVDNDTQLSPTSMSDFFTTYDINGDGEISRGEMHQVSNVTTTVPPTTTST